MIRTIAKKGIVPVCLSVAFMLLLFYTSLNSKERMGLWYKPLSEIREAFDFKYSETITPSDNILPVIGQLSKDGLKLYFTAQDNRGSTNIYSMSRNLPGQPFDNPKKLHGIFSSASYHPIMPSLTADEMTMVFVSSHDGTQQGNDLYIATRTSPTAEFSQARQLSEINHPDFSDSYPWISPNGLRIYFSRQYGSEVKLYEAARPSTLSRFSEIRELAIPPGLSNNNLNCFLSNDELEIYMLSGSKLFYAYRNSRQGEFSIPVEIVAQPRNSGYVNGITMTNDRKELFVFQSVGFQDTRLIKFINTSDEAVALSKSPLLEGQNYRLW